MVPGRQSDFPRSFFSLYDPTKTPFPYRREKNMYIRFPSTCPSPSDCGVHFFFSFSTVPPLDAMKTVAKLFPPWYVSVILPPPEEERQ